MCVCVCACVCVCVCVCVRACVCMVGCSLVLLPKGGTTVGTPPLAQCETEEDAKRDEEDGTHDPQAGEVILQHAHSESERGERERAREERERDIYTDLMTSVETITH